jgi:hypothetical protein
VDSAALAKQNWLSWPRPLSAKLRTLDLFQWSRCSSRILAAQGTLNDAYW